MDTTTTRLHTPGMPRQSDRRHGLPNECLWLSAQRTGAQRHTSRSGSDGCRTTGVTPGVDRGNDVVKTCSHFTAALPERDTSRHS